MPRTFSLACDVHGRYVLQVAATSLTAAERKASAMLIPGMASPHVAPLWVGSIKLKIRRTTEAAAHRAAARRWRKRRARR